MPRRRTRNLRFPVGGVDRRFSFQSQLPFTTPDALNVRSDDTTTGRERGGRRPGLAQYFTENINGPARMMSNLNVVPTPGTGGGFVQTRGFFKRSFELDWDTHSGTPVWSATLEDVTSLSPFTLIYSDLVDDVDLSQPILFDVKITSTFIPSLGFRTFQGSYELILFMDNDTPDPDDALVVRYVQGGENQSNRAVHVFNRVNGVITDFRSVYESTLFGGEPTVTFQVQAEVTTGALTISNPTPPGIIGFDSATLQNIDFRTGGTRFGFSAIPSLNNDRSLRIDRTAARFQILGEPVFTSTRNIFVVSAAKKLWSNVDDPLRLTQASETGEPPTTLPGDKNFQAVPFLGKLYISHDGAEPNTAIFDPATNTVTPWLATSGELPKGNPLISKFRNRIVLAGNPPHVWYMSAISSPTNWQFNPGDATGAVAGQNSEAGDLSDPITALVPFSDDYLLFGQQNSLWRLSGDPLLGGRITRVSGSIGIVGGNAWCWTPRGELLFLSLDGLYLLAPGGNSFPRSVSREKVPDGLARNLEGRDISLSYDLRDRGIHIFLTHARGTRSEHWWFDWETKSFWPVSYQRDSEPTVSMFYPGTDHPNGSHVLLGSLDGFVRYHSEDSSEEVSSYVLYGPLPLGVTNGEGILNELIGQPSRNSSPVRWQVLVGNNPEDAFQTAAPAAQGVWSPGLNRAVPLRVAGVAMYLRLSGTDPTSPWSMESIQMRSLGYERKRLL